MTAGKVSAVANWTSAQNLTHGLSAAMRWLQDNAENPSAWRYVTSEGSGIGADLGPSVGGQDSIIVVERDQDDGVQQRELHFEWITLGVGIASFGVGGGFSLRSFRSTGAILLHPTAQRDFELGDFDGFCLGLQGEAGGEWLSGNATSFILLGVSDKLKHAYNAYQLNLAKLKDALSSAGKQSLAQAVLYATVPPAGAYRAIGDATEIAQLQAKLTKELLLIAYYIASQQCFRGMIAMTGNTIATPSLAGMILAGEITEVDPAIGRLPRFLPHR